MLNDGLENKEFLDEIRLLIRYAVPDKEYTMACDYLESFERDLFAISVIKDFYTTLPDALEESLTKISVLEQKEQVYLLLLSTATHSYLYITNGEEGTFLGEYKQGIADKHILSFFDFPDSDAFLAAHNSVETFREYMPLEQMNEEICPSCGVKEGEFHTLGGPVEVCPWCGGQLNHCNCRFEQLDVEELKEESEIKDLEKKLDKKGRLPYNKEQRPSFLTE